MGGGGVTAFQPRPRPENPEKGENLGTEAAHAGFSPLSPFSGTGAAQNEAGDSVAAALAAVRAYRRTLPPKPPRKPRQAATALDASPPASPLPGVPLDWCEGVALLAILPAPDSITPHRWRAFQTTAARALHDHGAELHAAGWDALDVFGLHTTTPAANPSGMGVAWLLSEHGDVLDVSPDAVGLRRHPDGARLTYRRRSAMARAGVVPAWRLDEVPA